MGPDDPMGHDRMDLDARPLHDPWLVAVWPGMGAVAQIAGAWLVQQLGAEPVAEMEPGEFFDVRAVPVSQGLVQPPSLPRSTFYAWRNPDEGGHDLVFLLAEQQPREHEYDYAREVVKTAEQLGVRRVHTFAAMAAPIHPARKPRVFAVGTRAPLLDEVLVHGAERLEQGEIGGMNGVLLAAAATRELDGLCLLGEFPFFANQVPNPKASRAVLGTFASLAGLQLDFSSLDEQVQAVEVQLVRAMEQLQEAGESLMLTDGEEPGDDEGERAAEPGGPEPAPSEPEPEVRLDAADERRIEELFEAAREDRSRALELKAELDRHDVFKRYEDRFLDLFRKAS